MLVHERSGLLLVSDKGVSWKTFEQSLPEQGVMPVRPSRKK